MKSIILILAIFSMTTNQSSQAAPATASPAHVTNSFQFVVPAPFNRAAALFGPDGERCWAGPRWNPEFLHPLPGRDIEGAVFTVPHGARRAVWVNTRFDLTAGRMQYVSFVPGALVFTVDVRLTALTPATTRVEVTYARTALDAALNDAVRAMGTKDGENGPRWQQSIEECLKAAH